MDNSGAINQQSDVELQFQPNEPLMSLGKSKLFKMLSSTFTTTYLETLSQDSSKRRNMEHQQSKSNNNVLPSQRLFTLDEVSYHDSHSDCWVVIYDYVYDITSFLSDHPGGYEVIMEYAGHDATLAFKGVGHSGIAEESLKQYLVGLLVEEERIWSKIKSRQK